MTGNGMEKKYKCVFFDLDHTLWDYETNAKETLTELFFSMDLASRGVTDADSFYLQFRKVNTALWELYDRELIDQEHVRRERFRQILSHYSNCEEGLCDELSVVYLEKSPRKANLIPYAIDVLDYLSSRYSLTLVTNGFEEIQKLKLAAGNLDKYFQHIVTSQKAGHRKPSLKIFEYAMALNDIRCGDAVMIGDNLVTDIGGARAASIDTIFYNPERITHNERVSHEIACLSELKNIL
jgi:YjjG family noncanonical pyrimidine nucleotidase